MNGKERCTVNSHGDADDLLKNVPSELDKYVNNANKELQHLHDFIFGVALYTFCSVLDKISEFMTQKYKFVTIKFVYVIRDLFAWKVKQYINKIQVISSNLEK